MLSTLTLIFQRPPALVPDSPIRALRLEGRILLQRPARHLDSGPTVDAAVLHPSTPVEWRNLAKSFGTLVI